MGWHQEFFFPFGPYTRQFMNDTLILAKLAADELRVDLQTGRVWYIDRTVYLHPHLRRFKEKVAHTSDRGRVRFHFNLDGKKTTIAKSRLLYLAKHQRSVEVVDHVDCNRTNDSVENLGEHTWKESNRQGRQLQRMKVVENAIHFFEYIAFWGEEPPDHRAVPTLTGATTTA